MSYIVRDNDRIFGITDDFDKAITLIEMLKAFEISAIIISNNP